MSFCASGTIVAILLFDSSVHIHDLTTGTCITQLMKKGERDPSRVHAGGVNAAYLTASGSTAVTVSKDCTARIWDVDTGACTFILQVGTVSRVLLELVAGVLV